MNKPKLLYYSILKYQKASMELLENHFSVITLEDPRRDEDSILASVEVALAPLGYYFGKEKIDACTSLRAIASNTTGHPHIDVEYARSRGIEVITLKNEHEFLDTITPTAELAWGLTIALTRKMVPAIASVARGEWNRRPFPGNQMLSRMSLGVVGLGRLGTMMANYALKFGMRVSYFDPYVSSGFPGLTARHSLRELVSDCNVVSVHVPHEKQNERMFNKEIFGAFPRGAYFINTSRGELVDHRALLDALASGHLAGAAVDVFEDEFVPDFQARLKVHPLWTYAQQHDNLLITPHIGGSTLDAWSETEQHTIRRVISKLSGSDTESDVEVSPGVCWGIIPARGGSKSIPLKNLARLNGAPLIDYAIGAARRAIEVSRLICSTESDEIAAHCLSLGVEVDKRPVDLAGDHVATVEVLLEFVRRKAATERTIPEYLLLLESTSPFVTPADIRSCIDALNADPSADSAQTVTQVSSNSHAYNQRYHDTDGSHFLFPQERKHSVNKQSKPGLFIHGNLRVMRTRSLLRTGSIFGRRSIPIQIPRIRAMDVDNREDLELAEVIVASRLLDNKEYGP